MAGSTHARLLQCTNHRGMPMMVAKSVPTSCVLRAGRRRLRLSLQSTSVVGPSRDQASERLAVPAGRPALVAAWMDPNLTRGLPCRVRASWQQSCGSCRHLLPLQAATLACGRADLTLVRKDSARCTGSCQRHCSTVKAICHHDFAYQSWFGCRRFHFSCGCVLLRLSGQPTSQRPLQLKSAKLALVWSQVTMAAMLLRSQWRELRTVAARRLAPICRYRSTQDNRDLLLAINERHNQRFTYHSESEFDNTSDRPLVLLIGWLNSQQVDHCCVIVCCLAHDRLPSLLRNT